MGLDDMINKGKDALDKNKDQLGGDQAENVSDKVLDVVADLAKKQAPELADKIDAAREAADKAIGST